VAVEAKRGCSYRRCGGLYLVGGGLSTPCDRMPYPLDRCRTCGGGVKFTRGHQWLQPDFFSVHDTGTELAPVGCRDDSACPVCRNRDDFGPHLLLWIGRAHYSPESYLKESREMGVSRRIPAIPKGLVLGETWVLLAHLDTVPAKDPKMCVRCSFSSMMHAGQSDSVFKDGVAKLTMKTGNPFDGYQTESRTACEAFQAPKPTPGIFCAFVPRAVELLLTESDATPERVEKEKKRGVSVVTVPDGDKDHQGSVWDAKGEDDQPELPGVVS
jgi:hypothetical protein